MKTKKFFVFIVSLFMMVILFNSVFPNPSTDHITVKSEIYSKVRFYNSLGILLEEGIIFNDHFNLYVNNFSNGIYFIEVCNEINCTVHKIVIQ